MIDIDKRKEAQVEFCSAIPVERVRQNMKFDWQSNSGPFWFTILVEEVGEVAKAIQEGDIENIKAELIQVAAVACSMYEQHVSDRSLIEKS